MIFNSSHSVKRKRSILTIRDVWYDRDPQYTDADVVYYTQMEKPFGDEWYDHYTILINLEQNEDDLFKQLNSSSRNEIRAIAAKPGYTYSFLYNELTETLIEQFSVDYDEFTKLKGITGADRAKLLSYYKNGVLGISRICDAANSIVAWHVYRVNQDRVCLVYTMSTAYNYTDSRIKNEIGSANRYCHWKDIVYFKEKGVKLYDWGGWYNGTEDAEMLSINKFKEKFGGTIIPNYNCIVYTSFKGRLFRFLKRLKGK